MASRRLRLKAVINLPVRRGREAEQSPSSNTSRKEVDQTEEEKIVPKKCDDSVSLNDTRASTVESPCKTEIREVNLAHENTTVETSKQHQSVGRPSTNGSSLSKIVTRKRLKPAVNLSVLSRRPKDAVLDIQVETAADVNSVNAVVNVPGITRLQSKTTDLKPTLKTSENSGEISDTGIPSPLNSTSESRPSNVSGVKSRTQPVKFEFAKPSPRLVEASPRRPRLGTPIGTDDHSKVLSIPGSSLESHDTFGSSSSLAIQSLEKSLSSREHSVCSSAMSSCSSVYDDLAEPDTIDSSKPEKRTTHRRARKHGVNEQLSKAQRDFRSKFGNSTPDKAQLTMFDLIFYNPITNPMKITEISADTPVKGVICKTDDAIVERLAEESVDDIMEVEEDANTAMPAPQVKVGPDGSLIIDEKSLVIETTGSKKRKDELANSAVVMDSGLGNTTYNSFSKRVRAAGWSRAETVKFYSALNALGTDFQMMQTIFPNRSRRDIKLKFKKEDRLHRELIDRAIRKPLEFDYEVLQKELELQDLEEKENETKRNLKKKEKHAKSFMARDLDPEDTGVKRKRRSLTKNKAMVSNVEDSASTVAEKKKTIPTLKKKKGKRSKVPAQQTEPASTTDESECYVSSDENVTVLEAGPSEPPPETNARPSNIAKDSAAATTGASTNEFSKTLEYRVIAIVPEVAKESAINVTPHVTVVSDTMADSTVAVAPDAASNDQAVVSSPPRQSRRRELLTADDIDISSSDDEEKFLKTTRQTRYGRIPQRRVLSSSSSSDESDDAVDLDDAPNIFASPCKEPSVSPEPPKQFIPDLSQVEPGSLVILTTPGQSSFQLFMVGPKTGDDKTGTQVSRIPVSAAPEVLESISSNTAVEASPSLGEGNNLMKVE